ncbi:MAG TPA: magnesium/cobalt transporter CorA [Pyrinomonadaceae bacterium]|nr:magnesium/cobalt transporter CorA [Pyrinomonadaceae bacterium]
MEIFVHLKGAETVEEGFSGANLPELLANPDNLVWVDMEAPTKEDAQILADVFHFHPLTIEDAVETRNHPKVESYNNYLFLIVHGVTMETNTTNFVTRELDVYLGKNFVVTFHHDCFRSIDSVKNQVRSNSFLCERGADYLLHQILDQLIDLYIPVVDDYDAAINNLEDRIFQLQGGGSNKILSEIMDLKRSVGRLIRISSKQLDVFSRLANGEFPLIKERSLPFYRDIYDHLHRVSTLSENYQELVGGLLNIHFNVVANRTNDIVKFLTIFSAIILPLSLIAGIYGMNFENMPELKTRYGYFLTLGSMLLIAVALLIYFWHKGWIFQKDDD